MEGEDLINQNNAGQNLFSANYNFVLYVYINYYDEQLKLLKLQRNKITVKDILHNLD